MTQDGGTDIYHLSNFTLHEISSPCIQRCQIIQFSEFRLVVDMNYYARNVSI